MNKWIGDRLSQGQANWFACDITNTSELPRNRCKSLQLCYKFSLLCQRAHNSAIATIKLMELFTVAMKFPASPVKLFRFDDITT